MLEIIGPSLSCQLFSKLLKGLFTINLYEYLTNAGLLSNAQPGFRSNHSTSTTLHDVQDYISKSMDDGCATGVIFIDLKKAFDTFNHDILINKLKCYGLGSREL